MLNIDGDGRIGFLGKIEKWLVKEEVGKKSGEKIEEGEQKQIVKSI